MSSPPRAQPARCCAHGCSRLAHAFSHAPCHTAGLFGCEFDTDCCGYQNENTPIACNDGVCQ